MSILRRNSFILITLYSKALIHRIESCSFGYEKTIDVVNNKDKLIITEVVNKYLTQDDHIYHIIERIF